ncbi:uncharacterized protein TNCV_4468981 [Trichonephila clavipes]|nr:uncharacterized protein TNCV_4468981 [Trichonephila clavipes]
MLNNQQKISFSYNRERVFSECIFSVIVGSNAKSGKGATSDKASKIADRLDRQQMAAVAEWNRYRIVACLVTSSSPVPLKTRRVGQQCTLNLSRAETSFRWCAIDEIYRVIDVAAVAEWYRYRTVACLVTSSSPVPLKTRRVGQRCMLNLSRAETSSLWCGVVVRRGGASSGVIHVT